MDNTTRPNLKSGMVIKTKDDGREQVYLVSKDNDCKLIGVNYGGTLYDFKNVVAIWEGLTKHSTLHNIFACVDRADPIWEKLETIKLYIIREITRTKTIVCEHCHELGYVDSNCDRCGGKGIHKKQYPWWEVYTHTSEAVYSDHYKTYLAPNPVYWDVHESNCYWKCADKFSSDCIAYTTKDKAQHACNIRNAQNNQKLVLEQADIVVNTLSFNHNFDIIASNTKGIITGGLISDYGLENFDKVVYLNINGNICDITDGNITDITFAVSIGGNK